MKLIKYYEEQCGAIVILKLEDTLYSVEGFFQESDVGDKLTLEIIEMSEEEYNNLPESTGC